MDKKKKKKPFKIILDEQLEYRNLKIQNNSDIQKIEVK